jgi:t-SNARE complex subunit (syntaxin)
MQSDTYEKMEREIALLKDSMDILHELIHDQQQPIDAIEDAIQHSKRDAQHAADDLSRIDKVTDMGKSTDIGSYISSTIISITIIVVILCIV